MEIIQIFLFSFLIEISLGHPRDESFIQQEETSSSNFSVDSEKPFKPEDINLEDNDEYRLTDLPDKDLNYSLSNHEPQKLMDIGLKNPEQLRPADIRLKNAAQKRLIDFHNAAANIESSSSLSFSNDSVRPLKSKDIYLDDDVEYNLLNPHNRSASRDSNNEPLKLVDIKLRHTAADNLINPNDGAANTDGSTAIKDYWSEKFASLIRKTITNLLSVSNSQALSFLLTLIPLFPPAALIGSFIMVILSILQNPILLKFMQSLIPQMKPLADVSSRTEIPEYLTDFNNMSIKTSGLDFMKEAATYSSKLGDIALKKTNLKSITPNDLNTLRNSISIQNRKRLLNDHDT